MKTTNTGHITTLRSRWLTKAARVIVYNHSQIMTVLSTATSLKKAVVLIGGEPIIGGLFHQIVVDMSELYPYARFVAVTECGTSIGFALSALGSGANAIRLLAPRTTLEQVRNIASQLGAVIDESTNTALNLSFCSNPIHAVHFWIGNKL